MNLMILILAVTVLTGLGWAGAALYDLVARDGYGRRGAQPPRSHPPEAFEPHRHAA